MDKLDVYRWFRVPLRTGAVIAIVCLFALPATSLADTTLWYLSKRYDDTPNRIGQMRIVPIDIDANDASATFGDPLYLEGLIDDGHIPEAVTLMPDGSIVGATATQGYFSETFQIDSADLEARVSPITVTVLGTVGYDIEAMFTDCLGRVYAVDTGTSSTTATGNRLLRWASVVDFPNGPYEEIGDLAATGTDLDELGPGIVEGGVCDEPGYAADTGNIYRISYVNGTVEYLGTVDGVFNVHALDGSFFQDRRSRALIMRGHALSAGIPVELYAMHPNNVEPITLLGSTPTPIAHGFTGPMPRVCECGTQIPPDPCDGLGGDEDRDGVCDDTDNCHCPSAELCSNPDQEVMPPGCPDVPPECNNAMDDLQCYKVRDTSVPKFKRIGGVIVQSQFGTVEIDVRKPRQVCVPVDKDGSGITDPDTFVCCYQIKAIKPPPSTLVEVFDQFGELELELKTGKLVCQPCSRTLLSRP